MIIECRQHELQKLLLPLDELGKAFRSNRDLYYTLGQYFGYTKQFYFPLSHKKDPLPGILCSTCTKTTD